METQQAIIITLPSGATKIPIFSSPGLFQPTVSHEVTVNTSALEGQGHVTMKGSRKRKLETSHMTPEDKRYLKKMKNRVAAQNSRDKKKARMDELEALVNKMKDEKEQAEAECKRLSLENDTLLQINEELSKQQCSCKTVSSTADNPTVIETDDANQLDDVSSAGTPDIGPAAPLNSDTTLKGGNTRMATSWQAWWSVWFLGLLTLQASQKVQAASEGVASFTSQWTEYPGDTLTPLLSLDVDYEKKKWGPYLCLDPGGNSTDTKGQETWCNDDRQSTSSPTCSSFSTESLSIRSPASSCGVAEDHSSSNDLTQCDEQEPFTADEEELLKIVSEFPTSPVSPMSSDRGYESLDSPELSDPLDLDFISDLFPDLL